MKAILMGISLLLLNSFTVKAQDEFTPVNRDEIEKLVTDKSASDYYPKLLGRFLADDSTLTKREYRLLYYGFVFQESYSGYPSLQQDRVNEAYAAMDLKQVENIVDSILEKFPVNLFANYHKGLVLFYRDSTDPAVYKYRDRYYAMVNAILSSGNGRSCNTAFRTICVNDEYMLIYNYFEIEEFLGQSLQFPCDRMSVKPSQYYQSDVMYFDTSETFIYMKKMFNDDKEDDKKGKSKKKNKKSDS